MDDVFQRLLTLLARLSVIGEDLCLCFEGIDDIITALSVPLAIELGGVDGNVHVVPRTRLASVAADLVGPVDYFGVGY